MKRIFRFCHRIPKSINLICRHGGKKMKNEFDDLFESYSDRTSQLNKQTSSSSKRKRYGTSPVCLSQLQSETKAPAARTQKSKKKRKPTKDEILFYKLILLDVALFLVFIIIIFAFGWR